MNLKLVLQSVLLFTYSLLTAAQPSIDLAGDTDKDGWRDTIEVTLGTDPCDSTSNLCAKIESLGNDSYSLTWPTGLDCGYQIEFSNDLESGFSQVVAGPFIGDGSLRTETIDLSTITPQPSAIEPGFFRISATLPRPNIVFIMSDDHVAMAMGHMNHPDHSEVLTPNMDLLASRGVCFNRAYSNTSICRPSRATTFTGTFEYKHVTNFGNVSSNSLDADLWNQSYPILMANNDYRIGFAGKFGFGMELSEATYSAQFDKWGGFDGDGQGSYDTAANAALTNYSTAYPHVSRALGAFGKDFIQESVSAGENFCLTLFPKSPHLPNDNIDPLDQNKFDAVVPFALPTTWAQNFNDLMPPQPRFARPHQRRWLDEPTYQSFALGYYQLIAGMDAGIGIVLDELEASNVAHNTVVIYTSDNGYFLGSNGGWHGKVLPHEEGSRIPFIVYDPYAPLDTIGTTSDAIIGNVDCAATLLDYADLPVPAHMDGISIRPIVENSAPRIRDSMLLIQNWTAGNDDLSRALSVVTEEFKYTYWPYCDIYVNPTEEIYHIPSDSFENNNLIDTMGNLSAPLDTTTLAQLRSDYDGFATDWANNVPVGATGYQRVGVLFDRSIDHTLKSFTPISPTNTNYRNNYQDVTGQTFPN
ncbi:MAG: sulfatase-like hydrolase/transferase [Roseibacillus sp.]